jgi:hypothetical protein
MEQVVRLEISCKSIFRKYRQRLGNTKGKARKYVITFFWLNKIRYLYTTNLCKAFPVKFDTLYFMKSFRCEIALATIRATHHRDVLNYQQIHPFTVTAG